MSTLTWHEVGAYAIAAVLYMAHIVGLRRGPETAGRALLAVGVALHFADIGVRCYPRREPDLVDAGGDVAGGVHGGGGLSADVAALPAGGGGRVCVAGGGGADPARAPRARGGVTPAALSLHEMGRLGQAHILLATLGVAVFAFAAVLAIVYLFQDRSLKRKQLDRVVATRHAAGDAGSPRAPVRVDRLPGVHAGDRDRRDLGGAPRPAARPGTLRPEYLIAVGTWIAFAVLIIARVGAGWRGRRAAWLTLGGFGGTALVVAAYIIRHAV